MVHRVHGRPGTAVDRLDLPPATADEHRRIDADDWAEVYVVGDVHGCLEALERLLDRIGFGPSDLVVFAGDLVRKGPDSRGVLDVVRVHENMVSVRGNTEQDLIAGRETHPALGSEDIAFLESLPLVVSFADSLVVHGGLDHRKPFSAHDVRELVTMRSLDGNGYERPYWFEKRRELPRVYFGHTVLSEPYESPYAVGLDTGCVYGGALTAYHYGEDRFVSVEPETTHRSRSEESIVTPRSQPLPD